MNATVQVLDDGAEALVAARPRGAELSVAELRSFLELGAAQLESAMNLRTAVAAASRPDLSTPARGCGDRGHSPDG